MSNSQLDKLKSGIKRGIKLTLNLSSNVIGNFNNETKLPHILLLTNTQVLRTCKAFANGSYANIKLLLNLLTNKGVKRSKIPGCKTSILW